MGGRGEDRMRRMTGNGIGAEREVHDFRLRFADRLEARREELTAAWLEALARRLHIRPRRVFPSDQLLNHIPDVLAGLAENLRQGSATLPDASLSADIAELTRMRLEQGFDVQELAHEYRILGGLLFDTLEEERRAYGDVPGDVLVGLSSHLARLLFTLVGVTAGTYEEEEFAERMDVARRLEGYASTLEHQLRNGLQKALTAVEVLVSEKASDEDLRREYGERTRDFLRELAGRLEDVRTVALGYSPDRSRESTLEGAMRSVVAELEEEAAQASAVVDIREPVPGFRVDGARVETILINLVTNAIKYSDTRKDSRWIRLGAEWDETEGACRVCVEDNGLGIEEDEREHIFERFYRGRRVSRSRAAGSGLGLSIASQAVRQMGGRIWVERSEPGSGSTFCFSIPARHLETLAEEERAGEGSTAG